MNKNWRFVWQDNMYSGSCEPCTASVFSTLVRDATVNWKINTRRAIRKAVREGLSLDEFTYRSDFQLWCIKMATRPRAGEKFVMLSDAEKLIQWSNTLKDSLPDFIFAVPTSTETLSWMTTASLCSTVVACRRTSST